MSRIDFNADIGEGMGNEALLMPYLTSCNIACGGHAGGLDEMGYCIVLAKQYNVRIGAHPSYPDKVNFGRVELTIAREQLFDSIYQQVLLLHRLTTDEGLALNHLKPHGALYHKAATDVDTAKLLIEVVQLVDSQISLVGLHNSILEQEAEKGSIRFIKEGFADRAYQRDGSLVSRKEKGSMLIEIPQVIAQVRSIAHEKKVKTMCGQIIDLEAETICFHSDTTQAVELLKACHSTLNTNEK